MGIAIGIDLGTTNSAAAIDERQPRVLPTRMNEPLTPSVVSFRQPRANSGSGVILVGRAAVNNATNAPQHTIFSIKRLMGRQVDDPKVAEVRGRYPFAVEPSDDPDDRGVRVVLNDVKYTPVQISAMILKSVVDDAEKALGGDVTHAVITVPAYFSEAQRAATRDAGDQAGLIVKKIVDEPTAAAVAFGIDRVDEQHRVLVYDLGGGTFDLSIIQTVSQRFEILAISGDNWLGGDDFDYPIVNRIIEWVRAEHDFDPSQDKRFLMLAKQHAERTKIGLSGQDEIDIIIPAAARLPGGGLVDVDLVYTRAEFEQAIQPLVDRATALVRQMLLDQHLTQDDITAVLLVGGSTSVPLVRAAIVNLFGEQKVRSYIDPMQSVALGAAILAVRLSGVECPSCLTTNPDDAATCSHCAAPLTSAPHVGEIRLGEVTPRSLGIGAVSQDGRAGTFAVIIPKGTPYPLPRAMERTFYSTSENMIRVPVYEGEDGIAKLNDLQGIIEYRLPSEVPPNSPVTVRFNYDKDRVLKVDIRVHGATDLHYDTTLTRDRPVVDTEDEEEWREDLEATTDTAEHFLETYSEYLERGSIAKVQADIRRGRQAYAEGNRTVGKQVDQALRMSLLGSGVATQLFLAERAMDGAPSESAERLSRASRELRDAYRTGDRRRVEEISMALQMVVMRIFQDRLRQSELSDREFDGLLREGRL